MHKKQCKLLKPKLAKFKELKNKFALKLDTLKKEDGLSIINEDYYELVKNYNELRFEVEKEIGDYVVAFLEELRPKLREDGVWKKVPLDNRDKITELKLFRKTEKGLPEFEDGKLSGMVLGVPNEDGAIRYKIIINEEIVSFPEFDYDISEVECFEVIDGKFNGIVASQDKHTNGKNRYPAIDGRVILDLPNEEITNTKYVKNIGGKLNGVIGLFSRPSAELPVVDGKVWKEFDKSSVQWTDCEDVNGCLNYNISLKNGNRKILVGDKMIEGNIIDGHEIISSNLYYNEKGLLQGTASFKEDYVDFVLPVIDGKFVYKIGSEKIIKATCLASDNLTGFFEFENRSSCWVKNGQIVEINQFDNGEDLSSNGSLLMEDGLLNGYVRNSEYDLSLMVNQKIINTVEGESFGFIDDDDFAIRKNGFVSGVMSFENIGRNLVIGSKILRKIDGYEICPEEIVKINEVLGDKFSGEATVKKDGEKKQVSVVMNKVFLE